MTIAAQNLKRATRARAAVDVYAEKAYGKNHGEEFELQVADLATDLMHLLHVEGHDPHELVRRMERDYAAELADPES